MDNGEVIPGLDENWTFAGANLVEWMSGGVMFLIAAECVDKISRWMPVLVMVMIGTTLGLASLRKMFPDEERGLRNKIMSVLGLIPPGIPAPSNIQPVWSGAPARSLKANSQFEALKLHEIFAPKSSANEEEDLYQAQHGLNGSIEG